MKIVPVEIDNISDLFRAIKELEDIVNGEPTFYIFPDATSQCASAFRQAIKVQNEANELIKAADDGTFEELLDEAMDVIHAVETLLRYVGSTDMDIKKAQERVIKKNKVRGYYEESE